MMSCLGHVHRRPWQQALCWLALGKLAGYMIKRLECCEALNLILLGSVHMPVAAGALLAGTR